MAVQATHHAPSGRFIKVYLLTWGLLAAGGLTYLASVAWHPELFSPGQQTAQPDQSLRAANLALAEVGSVRRTVTEIQRDLGKLKETVDQRETEDRAAQARLASLEEKMGAMASSTPAIISVPNATAAGKQRPTKAQKTAEPNSPTRLISVVDATKDQPAPAAATEAAPAPQPAPRSEVPSLPGTTLETGSIAQPAPAITFGEPQVTPAVAAVPRSPYAVQLAAGPSLDALRVSWGLLVERHGSALASLKPRVVAPRAEGGPYRLVAGPLTSKAEADKVCADMGVGKQGCFSTTFVGEPL
jgi:hypothetical protein